MLWKVLTPVVIHTGSQCAMQDLQHKRPRDNVFLITSILTLLQPLHESGRLVVINWVPSYVGIPGNDLADDAAKAATPRRSIQEEIVPSLQQLKQWAVVRAKTLTVQRHQYLMHGSDSATWYNRMSGYTPLHLPPTITKRTQVVLHCL